MDSNTQGNIEVSDIFNTFTYLDDAVAGDQYEGQSLGDIAADLQTRMENGEFNDARYEDLKHCIQYINDAVAQNPDLGDAVLLDTSATNSSAAWKDDLIQGATFQMPDGEYYVAFRGTGDGRWTDNAKGMTLPSTQMQEAAAAYFNEVAERYGFTEDSEVYVTGHSKGGNEAQYVFMTSEYANLIDACYSMDGQGFSPEAIKWFKEIWGDEYEQRLQEMYSICGENDPVHQLGIRIIPDGNTYYVDCIDIGLLPWHDIKYMSGYKDADGNWHYDGIHWFTDENGNIINGEPGYGVRLGEAISEALMKLPEDKRDGVAVAVMHMIDLVTGRCLGYDDVDIDWWNFLGYGLPVLEKELFLTPEGQQALLQGLGMLAKKVYDDLGIWGCVGVATIAATVMTLCPTLVFTALAVAGIIVIGTVVLANLASAAIRLFDAAMDFLGNFFEGLDGFTQEVKDFFNNFVGNLVNKVVEFFKNLDPDTRYAEENPHFIVDTKILRDYGSALNSINDTIKSIDSRMDSLYWKVGLLDLWNLMQADILTSYNRHIKKAAEYCIDTATRFETTENDINRQW